MTLPATSRAQIGSYGPVIRCARSAVRPGPSPRLSSAWVVSRGVASVAAGASAVRARAQWPPDYAQKRPQRPSQQGFTGGARRGWGAGGPAAPPLRCPRRTLGHQRCGAARRAGWGTRPSLWRRWAALTHSGRPPRGVVSEPFRRHPRRPGAGPAGRQRERWASPSRRQAAQAVRWKGRAAEQAGRDARPPTGLASPRDAPRRGQLRGRSNGPPRSWWAARVSSVPLARRQCARPTGARRKARCSAARQPASRRRRRTLAIVYAALMAGRPLSIHRAASPCLALGLAPALSGERATDCHGAPLHRDARGGGAVGAR